MDLVHSICVLRLNIYDWSTIVFFFFSFVQVLFKMHYFGRDVNLKFELCVLCGKLVNNLQLFIFLTEIHDDVELQNNYKHSAYLVRSCI